MIIFFAFPFILVTLSIICCATTEKSLEDNDDLMSMGPRFRLKRGYTRSDMASTRGFPAERSQHQSARMESHDDMVPAPNVKPRNMASN